MEKWTNVVIHHSASDFGNARLIDQWHKQRGWTGIGYHFIILNGRPIAEWKTPITPLIGSIEVGRMINDNIWVEKNEIGAHTLGFNKNSIGICLIHKTKFYIQQFISLYNLCKFFSEFFIIQPENFYGHYELDKNKPDCPGFDMVVFRKLLKREITKNEFIKYLVENKKIYETETKDVFF